MENMKSIFRKFMKFWCRLDTIGSILLLILLGCLVISLVGIPKDMEEVVGACVYTESGETLSCEIVIKGEVTKYPFRNFEEYSICAYRDNILVSEMQYNTSRQQYGYCRTYRFTGIKDIKNDILVVEMDLHTLFPDRESQRCMIVAPGIEQSTALEIVRKSGDLEAFKEPFAWAEK